MSNNKIIYWIGNDVDENNKNKNRLKSNNIRFVEFSDIENAMTAMEKLKFEFVLIIINCDLFENFINVYNIEFLKASRVVISTIIICDNIYEHINKKFVNDQFYNPGGITDNIQGVINYINYVQNSYYYKIPNDEKYLNLPNQRREGYGEIQCQITSEERELIIPLIWNKIVSLKIHGKKLSEMQRMLIYNYSSLKDYIYPSREKIFKIPEQLLAKYFLYLYTIDSQFYRDLNRILSHDEGFDIYREYITTMLLSLKNKTFKTDTTSKLYRAQNISKNDFDKLYNLYENKKECENILFFSKNFLSFSKNEDIIKIFMKFEKDKMTCKFIIESNPNSQFGNNIDIGNNSKFEREKEVLFLPMSCFIVKKIIKKENSDKNIIYNIYLKYLDEYNKKIEDKFRRINQNIKDRNDIENSFLTDFGKNVYKLYENIILDYTKYIKNKYLTELKIAIPDYNKKYTSEEKAASIKFDTEEEIKKYLSEEKNQIHKAKEITNKVIYEVREEDIGEKGYVKILGEKFVELNKDKVELEINGKKVDLCSKYKLNKGKNEVIFFFKEKLEDFSYLFYEVESLSDISGLETWDTSNAKNFAHLFSGCGRLTSIHPLLKWETGSVINFSCIFMNCTSLKDISTLKNWNVSNGNFFSYIFYNCSELEDLEGVENWDVSKGKFFSCSFAYCSKLKDVNALKDWNINRGLFFSHLFFNCHNLKDINGLEKWDISRGGYFDYMFCNCNSLFDLTPLKDWNVKNAKNFSYTFCGCNSLIDISPLKNWNLSSDCYLSDMFKGCNTLEETRPNWFYRTL